MLKNIKKAFMLFSTLLLGGLLGLSFIIVGYGVMDSALAETKVMSANIENLFLDKDDRIFHHAHLTLRLEGSDALVDLAVDKSRAKHFKKGQTIRLKEQTNYFTKAKRYELIEGEASEN